MASVAPAVAGGNRIIGSCFHIKVTMADVALAVRPVVIDSMAFLKNNPC